MAQAEIHEVLSVDKERFFKTVTQYENYPKFVEGCSSVEVQRKGPGRARVTYHVSMIKEVSYTLDLTEDLVSGKVEWTLVESDFFKKNTGFWEIKSVGKNKSEVRYGLEVEFKIPVPGLILNRLVKGNLPSMLRSFEKQAQKTNG